ncbi:hypothetical protein BU52_00985 [Streptomyces toyocaensis]|uniref:ParB-like N-terminal domain-containing protein n=1 Tax=Streptomyces toyocaensis TaxID=55952 RepID=A0A081XYN1_STRTO|nr:ParB/RepB/Spo0J family partition protein [Streptomyces toyocaensis]KES08654.1 hypothetical protein BU52_00985 [Streptomyces toyocaensis]
MDDAATSEGPAPARVPISSLLPADSPRLTGENPEHVESLAAARNLPPILVQRGTMRVIDGMHRVRAALLRGEDTITVTFFEGDDGEAFLRAVDANITHGLPLSLADREAAARRILATRPQWSDRTVAAATGLSHTTVGAIRRRSGLPAARDGSRVGRDGRARPVDAAAGRRRASEVIAMQPDAPLRAIAREAGISVGTARDVRERLRAGRDPVPDSQRGPAREPVPSAGGPAESPRPSAGSIRQGPDWRSVVGSLSRDPAVRYAQNGRAFVRWVDGHVIEPVEWCELIDAVPPHWRNSMAELARSCAGAWLEFAQELEQRARTTSGPGVA